MFEGQLSLFDIAGEEDRNEFKITFPDVGEYSKDELLAFEKEILGESISAAIPWTTMRRRGEGAITATSAQFMVDEETDAAGRWRTDQGCHRRTGGRQGH